MESLSQDTQVCPAESDNQEGPGVGIGSLGTTAAVLGEPFQLAPRPALFILITGWLFT